MDLEIHYDHRGEWAALYQDGNLITRSVGDSYLAEEQALALCGVKVVSDSEFLRGGSQRDDAAVNLAEIDEYVAEKHRAQGRAEDLRAKAQAMIEEADGLDSQFKN